MDCLLGHWNMGGNMSTTIGEMGGAVPSGATSSTNIFIINFTQDFGSITALTGSVVTKSITGLLTTDAVHLQCVSGTVAGMSISNVRVSATDTLEVLFTTAVALGIALGSLNYRLTVLR